MKIPFYKSTINLNSIQLYSLNNSVENLLEKLQKKYGEYIVLVNNIASSYKLALSTLETKRGDKILCSIDSYPEVAQSIRSFDSEPLFVDISLDNGNMDYESFVDTIKNKSEKKLKYAILSHYNGVVVNIEKYIKIASKYNISIIEDFTDISLDRNVNIEGDVAIFSLNDRLNSSIKGAFIVFKNKNMFMRAQMLINSGVVYSNNSLPYIYDIVNIGYDYKMSYIAANIFYNDLIFTSDKRDKIASVYYKELSGIDSITLPKHKDKMIFFNIMINRNRDFFAKKLIEKGIEVAMYNIPLSFTSYYKNKYSFKVTSFPNALKSYQHLLTLPCNNSMTIQEAEYIAQCVKDIAKEHV